MEYIKEYIRQQNETVSSFAKKLHLSRPTLDTYIMMYEANKPLPKEKYQVIFDFLFQDLSRQEGIFSGRLEVCNQLLENNERIGMWTISSKRTDHVSRILNKMKDDLFSDNCDEDLYVFINMLISSYFKEIFYNLVHYFLTLNGYKDIELVTERQKAFFAKFYRVFQDCSQSSIIYDIEDYEKFQNRCKEIRKKKEYMDIIKNPKQQRYEDEEIQLLRRFGIY